jgi:HPt (histidine-containing phosphotransfer) domain-containing protein
LSGRHEEALKVNAEKQDISGVNREIIARALQSQEAGFNHLKTERFDPQSLWDRVDGDMDLLRELVGVFAEESPRMLAKIHDAIQHSSPIELEKASHKIKGSVLQFSAHAAAANALALEEAGRSGSIAGAGPLLEKLRQEIEILQTALNSMICL